MTRLKKERQHHSPRIDVADGQSRSIRINLKDMLLPEVPDDLSEACGEERRLSFGCGDVSPGLRRNIALRPLSTSLAWLLLICPVLTGCGEKPPAPTPLPEVTATILQAVEVPNVIELPGRIEAVRTAEVRARVDGIVERRLFQEGSDVVAGAALFQIDPRDKRAALQAAIADLRRNEAAQTNAAQVVKRYEPLVGRKAISAQEFDAATSQLRQADAEVAQARATADRARLELGYTRVVAPIAGRAGRAKVTEGALVSASGATLMTTVEQLAPIYATFSPSNTDVLDLNAQIRTGMLKVPRLSAVEVHLILENGAAYGSVGHLDFADLTVDPTTGGQTVRARFANPQRILLPGQFIRGRIYAGVIPNGIRVPQRAVQISDKQATVTVIAADSTVASRDVELGALEGAQWVIRSGLKPGERVVVDGWQKVQPGQKVKIIALRDRSNAKSESPKSNARS